MIKILKQSLTCAIFTPLFTISFAQANCPESLCGEQALTIGQSCFQYSVEKKPVSCVEGKTIEESCEYVLEGNTIPATQYHCREREDDQQIPLNYSFTEEFKKTIDELVLDHDSENANNMDPKAVKRIIGLYRTIISLAKGDVQPQSCDSNVIYNGIDTLFNQLSIAKTKDVSEKGLIPLLKLMTLHKGLSYFIDHGEMSKKYDDLTEFLLIQKTRDNDSSDGNPMKWSEEKMLSNIIIDLYRDKDSVFIKSLENDTIIPVSYLFNRFLAEKRKAHPGEVVEEMKLFEVFTHQLIERIALKLSVMKKTLPIKYVNVRFESENPYDNSAKYLLLLTTQHVLAYPSKYIIEKNMNYSSSSSIPWGFVQKLFDRQSSPESDNLPMFTLRNKWTVLDLGSSLRMDRYGIYESITVGENQAIYSFMPELMKIGISFEYMQSGLYGELSFLGLKSNK